MTIKEEIIESLKAEYPSLKKVFDGQEIELTEEEYNETIELWADIQLAKEAEAVAEAEKAATKTALLERLGITEEEARLLLS